MRFAVTGIVAIGIGGNQMTSSVRLAAIEDLKAQGGDKVAILTASDRASDRASDVFLGV